MTGKFATFGLVLMASVWACPATFAADQKIDRIIQEIHGFEVPAPDGDFDAANKAADARWKYLEAHAGEAIPAIRRYFQTNIEAGALTDFGIIDLGYFLALRGDAEDRNLVINALGALDLQSRTTAVNTQQLFLLIHRLTETGDPRLLGLMQRLYIDEDVTVWNGNPMHPLDNIKGAMLIAFTFGAMGDSGEDHLISLLEGEHAKATRILGALNWIGSPKAVAPVLRYFEKKREFKAYQQALGLLMRVGGSEGPAAVEQLFVGAEDVEAKAFLERILPQVQPVNSELMTQQIQPLGDGPETLPDAEMEKHIQIMLANKGNDPDIRPVAVLNSTLDGTYLVDQLMEIRRRMFWRLTPEALDDVVITNHLINTLRYRIAGN